MGKTAAGRKRFGSWYVLKIARVAFAMNIFVALAGSVLRPERWRSAQGLRLFAAILAFSLTAVQADRAVAYRGGGTLPSVGSLDEYIRQSHERASFPQGSSMGPRGQGSYGAQTGSRSQMNPAVLGAVILGQWALQRLQDRH